MIALKTKNGNTIPPIGLGTYPLQGEKMAGIVEEAIKIGYRLIDTSDDYRGESGIGMALDRLLQQGYKREDLFLLTKISDNDAYAGEPLEGIFFNENSSFMSRHSVDEIVRYKLEISLREMHTDYIDAVLIHHPYPNFNEDIWKSLVTLRQEGKIRYIGVSNFYRRHINSIYHATSVYPTINEIYISPIGTKEKDLAVARELNILPMVYSPLKDITAGRVTSMRLRPIMDKYNKSLAQIVLRWNIDRGCMPLPKSGNMKRLRENFDILDFQLTKDEIENISKLNYDYQFLVDSKLSPGL